MSIDIDERSSIPLWAALGAPLVGVPLLVVLLALGASEPNRGGHPEPDHAPEQIEAEPVDAPVDVEIALEGSHG